MKKQIQELNSLFRTKEITNASSLKHLTDAQFNRIIEIINYYRSDDVIQIDDKICLELNGGEVVVVNTRNER